MITSKTQLFIEDLRSLPHSTKQWLLWISSSLMFSLVFFMWTLQVNAHLKTVFVIEGAPRIANQTPIARSLVSEQKQSPATTKANQGTENILGDIGNLLKDGTAGIFSFIKNHQGQNGKGNPYGEGQELDQFLKYQKEYHQDFPKSP